MQESAEGPLFNSVIRKMGVTTMSTIWTKSHAEMRQVRGKGVPFICLKEPFVWSDSLGIGPSICLKRPFICQLLKSRGFTLVELIITLVIAAILLTIAAPNMSVFIQRDRLVTQANELVADLSFARNEAVKRGAPVTVCKQDPALSPAPACNATAGDPWTPGRVIWVDLNGDTSLDANEVLRQREPLDGAKTDGTGNRLIGDGNASGTGGPIVFNGLGMAGSITVGPTQFVFCDSRGPNEGVAVGIGPTGRAAVGPKGMSWDGGANLTAADCP